VNKGEGGGRIYSQELASYWSHIGNIHKDLTSYWPQEDDPMDWEIEENMLPEGGADGRGAGPSGTRGGEKTRHAPQEYRAAGNKLRSGANQVSKRRTERTRRRTERIK
jgi:hypothetical protein